MDCSHPSSDIEGFNTYQDATSMPLSLVSENSLVNDVPEVITRLKMDWQIATDGNCILKSKGALVYLIKWPLDNIMVYLIFFFSKAYKLHQFNPK